ncbi:unnamed protein product [Adineta steineri]|uniref:Uncharacterized protein n=1 Tax=Adineta steineri TaxID=433720 RepID=A0A814TJW1_9BILA|nr:unnamed protein product [Adineta steineri]CAF3886960.1 unnamed protein product [Adineta steineri]
MKSLIFLAVLIFIIFSSAQARSFQTRAYNKNMLRELFIDTPTYSDLVALLKDSQIPVHKKNDYKPILASQPEYFVPANQQFIPMATRSPVRRNRLSNAYGRKSHWDTFFGKK